MFSHVDLPMQTASLSERAPEIALKRTLTNVGLGKRWNAKFVCLRVEKAEVETTTTPTKRNTLSSAATCYCQCVCRAVQTWIRERACKRPNATA